MTVRSLDMIAAALHGATWAIRPETLEEFRAILRRDAESRAYELGEPSDRSDRVTVRDGIATVAIGGPLFRYANLLTAYCGASSYADVQHGITTAMQTPGLKALVLAIDSPGGECKGMLDTAEMIYSLRGKVPVIAHVDGQACSAALLLAAAADRIVADPAAVIGCAGAIIGFDKLMEESESQQMVWFTADRSPRKNASVLEPDGASQMQQLINQTGNAYFDALAKYRNVDPTTVHERFGLGAVFAASDALTRGMIDSVSVAESLSTQLAIPSGLASSTSLARRTTSPSSSPRSQSQSMDGNEQDPNQPQPGASFAAGAAVRSTVTRDVAVAENDEGTVAEVMEGVTVYAVEFANGTYSYLLEADLAEANGGADAPAARARVRAARSAARDAKANARVSAILALAGRVSQDAITAAIANPTATAEAVALAHLMAQKPSATPLQALQADADGTPKTPGTPGEDAGAQSPAAAAKAMADRINARRAGTAGRTLTGARR